MNDNSQENHLVEGPLPIPGKLYRLIYLDQQKAKTLWAFESNEKRYSIRFDFDRDKEFLVCLPFRDYGNNTLLQMFLTSSGHLITWGDGLGNSYIRVGIPNSYRVYLEKVEADDVL